MSYIQIWFATCRIVIYLDFRIRRLDIMYRYRTTFALMSYLLKRNNNRILEKKKTLIEHCTHLYRLIDQYIKTDTCYISWGERCTTFVFEEFHCDPKCPAPRWWFTRKMFRKRPKILSSTHGWIFKIFARKKHVI